MRREIAERRATTSPPRVRRETPSAPRVRTETPAAPTRRPRVTEQEDDAPEVRRTPTRAPRPAVDTPSVRTPRAAPPVEEVEFDDPFSILEEEERKITTREKRTTRKPAPEKVEEIEPAGPAFEAPEEIEPFADVPLEPEEQKEPERRRPAVKTTPAPATSTAARKPKSSGGEVIRVSSLTMDEGKSSSPTILRGVDLVVGKDQLTVIMGPSGAGKSVLLHCLAGIETPTSGTITVDGQNVSAMKASALVKYRRTSIGMVFGEFNLIPTLSVADNIRLPILLRKGAMDSGWYDQVVTTLRLSDALSQKPADLSVAQCQRVALARALITKPAVVLADEPTVALNTEASGEFMSLLRDLVDTADQTILVTTHDPAIASYADCVIVMQDGLVVTDIATPTINRVMDVWKSVSGGSRS